MSALQVSVAGTGLWMAGYPDAAAWAARAPVTGDEPLKPKGEAFDRVNRRRASQMGRAIGDAVAEALGQAGVEPRTTPVIVGSSIGEASAMIGLLDQMCEKVDMVTSLVVQPSIVVVALKLSIMDSQPWGLELGVVSASRASCAA